MRFFWDVLVSCILFVITVSSGFGCTRECGGGWSIGSTSNTCQSHVCPPPGYEVRYDVALSMPQSLEASQGPYASPGLYDTCDVSIRGTYAGHWDFSHVILPADQHPRQASGQPGPGHPDVATRGWAPNNWGRDARYLTAEGAAAEALKELPFWGETKDGRGVILKLRGHSSRGQFVATSVEIIERNGLPAKKEPVCVSHLQIGETEQVAPGIWRKLERSDPRCGPCVFNYSTGPDVKFEEVEQVADAAGCKRASFMAFCCPSE